MNLSERLGIHAQDFALAAREDHDFVLGYHQLRDLEEALTAAAALAKRYEDAPSGEVWQHAYVAGQRSSTIVITREPEDGIAIMGQRVRILLDTEGV